jgi:transglutaminase-like putative cysteine protease
MSYGQEKRLLLGLMAALAPLPLPFSETIGWPAILVYWVVVGTFMYRTGNGDLGTLPNWAMNLLGLIYLPLLYLDLVVFWGGTVMRPLVHLAMFSLGVKLLAVRRDKDKWHVFLIVFFLFLASMGTSVHPAIVLFLIAFLVLGLLTLTRFASFHVLGSHQPAGLDPKLVPVTGFVTGATLFAVFLAVPLFTLLPRLQRPLVAAPGVGGASLVQFASFSDTISLDAIGRVRTNRNVAMRVDYDRPVKDRELRFKAAVYDGYERNSWRRSAGDRRQIQAFRDGFYHLGEGRAEIWAEVWQEPIDGSGLALPVESVRIESNEKRLSFSSDGTVSLARRLPATLNYRVGLSGEVQSGPSPIEDREAALEAGGVSARVTDLASQVMGDGVDRVRAQRLEVYLATNFEYTLDLLGRQSEEILDDFLFTLRKGHCEYFASAMVMMLRSQGIPARFVTGFLGAELNPIEGYYVVRQSNAHAWVEAYLPNDGWTVFDPTPASGRPIVSALTLRNLLSQGLDFLIFRWDRYVLTFGFDDQVSAFIKIRTLWDEFWQGVVRSKPNRRSVPLQQEPEEIPDSAETSTSGQLPLSPRNGTLLVLLACTIGGWWWWRDQQAFSATRAYRILRARVRRYDPSLLDSVPPIEMATRVEARVPAADGPLNSIVDTYLQESFGGRVLNHHSRRVLREKLRIALREISAGYKKNRPS